MTAIAGFYCSPNAPGSLNSASLQSQARVALTDKRFETEKGLCSRFVRQVTVAEHKQKYRALFGASAIVTTDLFLRAGKAWPASRMLEHGGILPGDILFKRNTSGKFGHVGIYLGDGLVAENSSTSTGRVQGAKGIRTLAQYGRFDYIGRLPGNNGPRLILAVVRGKQEKYFRVPGAELDYRTKRWVIDRDVVAEVFNSKAKAARVPLRDSLSSLKLNIVKTGDHRRDARDPRFYVFVNSD
ncbi:MAG TPA: hypothetical protein VF719_07245 [Abditibacteriaceae bacterium]